MSRTNDAIVLAIALWAFADKKTKALLRDRYVSVIGMAPMDDTSIEELDIPMQVNTMLRRVGIDTVEQLRRMSKKEVMQVKGIGEMYASDILEAL